MSAKKLAWPVRLEQRGDGAVAYATVEQDTIDELETTVAVIVSTPVGSRDELPGFGVTQLAFQLGDITQDPLRSQVTNWEPRADLDVAETLDALAPMLRTLQIAVTASPPQP